MSRVVIDRVAAGGSGVGRLEDGMVVFVPRTAPGDVTVVAVTERKDRWARGSLVSIDRPSDDRTEPRCAHYVSDSCGGCQMQHITIERQRLIKSEIVGDALRRIGQRMWANPEVEAAPNSWRYRRKITLTRGANDRIGYHRFDDPGTVFELQDCLIADEGLIDVWKRVLEHRRLFPPDLSSLIISRGRDDRIHLTVRADSRWDGGALAEALQHPNLCIWSADSDGDTHRIAGQPTSVSPLSFEQTSLELADRIRRRVVSHLGAEGGVAWDLYGGFGDTAHLLSGQGYTTWSVDVDRGPRIEIVEDDGSPIRWVYGRVEHEIAGLPRPDVVVVNPPRAGLAKPVTRELNGLMERRTLRRLGYVSCDPATLARDIRRLPAAEILDVTAYDLFPHTSHVETAVILGPVS